MVKAFKNNTDSRVANNFLEEITNQSRWMRLHNEEKEDEYNFNQALKFVLNWKPTGESEVEGGRKMGNGRKKTKSKAYKETKKNKTFKKQ